MNHNNVSANLTAISSEKVMNGQDLPGIPEKSAQGNVDDKEAATETVIRLERFYVNAKSLLDYLAKVIGVSRQSDSMQYIGELLPDGRTIYIDLTHYEIIPYENIPHDGAATVASLMPVRDKNMSRYRFERQGRLSEGLSSFRVPETKSNTGPEIKADIFTQAPSFATQQRYYPNYVCRRPEWKMVDM